ncbi:hypothetical protein GH714_005542 [Hevea brasiliensis]|uniref:Uncharacterized protein n=1 Tax=Hevea brasiliensis TaxID=3981 RepID=A0A6A6KB10_HEVBR|nr:hypothetical protein GH714_005542 [Hevea brasiliensis]
MSWEVMAGYLGWGGLIEESWRKGPWTAEEDRLLIEYVRLHGEGRWNSVARLAGLRRNGKSCRLRWVNYLRPDLKRGQITPHEESIILELHARWGNSEIGDLKAGKLIHGKSVVIGFVLDIIVANSLMFMYCKCGEFRECLKLFGEMPERNATSWNVVIAGYADSGDRNFTKEIIELVKDMQIEGFKPDGFTVSSLLLLCNNDNGKMDYGRELHGFIVRNELGWGFLGSDSHLGCCLIDMYSRNNKVDSGKRVFDRMKRRNVYVWTAMINGYVQNGAMEEALVLFHEMQVKDGVEPNRVSLLSILPTCGLLADFTSGKQIHGYAIRKKLNHDLSLCNALIDMYSKCGNLNYARRVFEDISFCRDAISWSSLISGYGLHGMGKEAVFLYDRMLQKGNKPDMITVVGALSACGRSGLVDEGLRIYNSAMSEYGIGPTAEICACLVDMLGRSGRLEMALDFIKAMPMEPGPSVWGLLLVLPYYMGILRCRI